MSRVVVIVLDGVGAGALPDAAAYGDTGADTLGHVLSATGVELPVMASLGLGAVLGVRVGEGIAPASRATTSPRAWMPPPPDPAATYGRLRELGAGKDTTAGHWELMGLVVETAFPTYPEGFPPDVIEPFEAAIGRRVLANRPASGTEIIADLGAEHMAGGRPIVYTSADSVFQVACHEDVVPVEKLYEWCLVARRQLVGRHAVGRVIARPFAGEPGAFARTPRRRDFSLPPTGTTYLDLLHERGIRVVAVGKIGEIFTQRGVDVDDHTTADAAGLAACRDHLARLDHGLVFANLVEFDMAWGHRNDAEGFAAGLAEVDRALPGLLGDLRRGDALMLCADHGVDPTTPGTDHTREYSPLLATGLRPGRHDGLFADVGATAFALLTGEAPSLGGTAVVA